MEQDQSIWKLSFQTVYYLLYFRIWRILTIVTIRHVSELGFKAGVELWIFDRPESEPGSRAGDGVQVSRDGKNEADQRQNG